MQLRQLLDVIEAASWLTNLGRATSSDFVLPISNLDAWQRFVASASAAEFELTHDADAFSEFPYSEMSWLPTSNDEPDPIHGEVLTALAQSAGTGADLVAAKLAAFKASARSQRSTRGNPVLSVGPVNLSEAALAGGRYACRMAAAESLLGKGDFWCKLVPLYAQGNWPLAVLPDRRVVVL